MRLVKPRLISKRQFSDFIKMEYLWNTYQTLKAPEVRSLGMGLVQRRGTLERFTTKQEVVEVTPQNQQTILNHV